MTFHDGTKFDADAVIWNLDRFFKNDSPQFEPAGAGLIRARNPVLDSYRKVDDMTVAITTKVPASYFPFQAVYILFTSPASFEKAGHDWGKRRARCQRPAPGRSSIENGGAAAIRDAGAQRRLLGCRAQGEGRPRAAAAYSGG